MRWPRIYHTDDWQYRCTKCGRTRSLRELGGHRIGTRPVGGKWTLGWCRGCKGLRIIALEITPEARQRAREQTEHGRSSTADSP